MNHLVNVFWTGEETGKKAAASDVASQMKNLRDDTGQKMFSKTDWLTEQQIARYFSRLSALTRTCLQQRSPAVSMTEDEEADVDDLASDVETNRSRQKIGRDRELCIINLTSFSCQLPEVDFLLTAHNNSLFNL